MAPTHSHCLTFLVLVAIVWPGSSRGQVFTDITASSGVDFVHTCGSKEKDWILEVNGSGVALFDCDGDGDLDLYFVNGSRLDPDAGGATKSTKPIAPTDAESKRSPVPCNALYRNDGEWRFRDVTESSGTGDDGWGCGVAVADADNDGDNDLYVTNWGPNVLYLNDGSGRFRRASSSGAEDPGWGAGCSFLDADRDGLVDLYVANYLHFDPRTAKRRGAESCRYKTARIFCGPGGLRPQADVMLRNLGNGRFRDVTRQWGLGEVKPGFGLGTLAVDVNRDGFDDILVANDTSRNFCFLNQDGQGFREAALYLGFAYNDYGTAQAGMGLASGDIRGQGRDDVFVTNFEDDTNTLYRNEAEGFFVEGTRSAGLGAASYKYLGWGTGFFDSDNDGDLDLFVANGHVAPQADQLRSSPGYRQRNQLFLNDGRGRFKEAAGLSDLPVESSRGAAVGDLDGDGRLDIVVSNIDARPTLLQNVTGGDRQWLQVSLCGTKSNRSAVGARVTVVAGGGTQQRVIQSGGSYASHHALAAHFGLQDAPRIERLTVDWPSGRRESFPPPKPRQRVVLTEGTGTPD